MASLFRSDQTAWYTHKHTHPPLACLFGCCQTWGQCSLPGWLIMKDQNKEHWWTDADSRQPEELPGEQRGANKPKEGVHKSKLYFKSTFQGNQGHCTYKVNILIHSQKQSHTWSDDTDNLDIVHADRDQKEEVYRTDMDTGWVHIKL